MIPAGIVTKTATENQRVGLSASHAEDTTFRYKFVCLYILDLEVYEKEIHLYECVTSIHVLSLYVRVYHSLEFTAIRYICVICVIACTEASLAFALYTEG